MIGGSASPETDVRATSSGVILGTAGEGGMLPCARPSGSRACAKRGRDDKTANDVHNEVNIVEETVKWNWRAVGSEGALGVPEQMHGSLYGI